MGSNGKRMKHDKKGDSGYYRPKVHGAVVGRASAGPVKDFLRDEGDALAGNAFINSDPYKMPGTSGAGGGTGSPTMNPLQQLMHSLMHSPPPPPGSGIQQGNAPNPSALISQLMQHQPQQGQQPLPPSAGQMQPHQIPQMLIQLMTVLKQMGSGQGQPPVGGGNLPGATPPPRQM
jgi:hypothetical protein